MEKDKLKEIERLKNVYKLYDSSKDYSRKYLPIGRYSYMFFSLIKHLNFLIKAQGLLTLEDKKILDIGCGFGHNFANLYYFGANPKKIFGLDLLKYRLDKVKKKYSINNLINCNAEYIPLKDKQFDIVSQFVVFSSILDDEVCKKIGSEMLRVLKDDGMIIWYDSYGGKKMSEHTRSYTERDIKQFFPNCKYEFHRIVPHLQLSLRFVKYSFGWIILDIIEKLFPFWNCMQLCVIKK